MARYIGKYHDDMCVVLFKNYKLDIIPLKISQYTNIYIYI